MALGTCGDFLNINPMKFLFLSAVINGILAPFLLCGILLIAGDQELMKKQPSSLLNRVVVGITTVVMFAAGLAMFYGMWHGDV